jgi:two-component system, NtrC family, sensor histidine kinase PilS
MAENAYTVRAKALIGFRATFITLLLGSSFLFKIEYFHEHPMAISHFIIFLYSLTIIYSLLLSRVKNLFVFIYIQLVLDVLAEIGLIYITGGIESWFSFTLILTVLSSSILLNKRAGYVMASLSSIFYGLLLDLQYYNLLPIPHEAFNYEREFLYNIFIHTLSLYITAYLSGYLSSSLEKTVQKLKEKDTHLKDLEFFNREVIESLPSGVFTTDMNGNTVIFNKAAEKITGAKKESVIGGKIDIAMPFLNFPFREGRYEEILQTGQGQEGRKIIGMTISVLRDISGAETGTIGVFQDLTQMKKLETEIKQKEKWAAIGELSANIAHEIRNPLASMKSSIEMLKEDNIPAKHKGKLMDIALKEMERLNNVITDFLMYSSPRAFEFKRTDLHLLLDENLSLLRNVEQNKGNIEIRKDFSGTLFINIDPQKIRQVFWNLGVNAIEAMNRGGKLTVSTKPGPDTVRIIFEDTGAGISPENLEKIFYPFFTTKNEGTGLGLAIAYRIIEEHGGRLTVQSVPGIKTVFEIILRSNYGKN